MNRKSFIQLLSAGVAGGGLFESAFGGERFAKTNWKGEVMVIGAGAAGLYAAYLLKKARQQHNKLVERAVYRRLRGLSKFKPIF